MNVRTYGGTALFELEALAGPGQASGERQGVSRVIGIAAAAVQSARMEPGRPGTLADVGGDARAFGAAEEAACRNVQLRQSGHGKRKTPKALFETAKRLGDVLHDLEIRA